MSDSKKTDYADTLRAAAESINQSDSGMTRSDDDRDRIAALRQRIKEAESSGAGRGQVNPPNAYKKGGTVRSSASKRADGCIEKGHTKGRYM
jgi:hypothetical protein